MAGHWHTHGFLMWTSFLFLFPLGTVLIRTTPSKSSTPFVRHWIVQLLATILSLSGALVGLSHTHWSLPKSLHTILGSIIALSLVAQALLGWRHHVAFLRTRTRTWMARVHVWLGRGVLVAGWTNVLVGISHHGHHLLGIRATGLVGGLIAVEAVGVGLFVWVVGRRRKAEGRKKGEEGEEGVALTAGVGRRATGEEYFALGMSDDEGGEDDDGKFRKSAEVTRREGGGLS